MNAGASIWTAAMRSGGGLGGSGVGDAAALNGSSQFLSVDSNAGLQPGDIDFELIGWLLLTTKATTQVIVGKYAGAGNRQYMLFYNQTTDRFRFQVSNDGTATTGVNADVLGSPSIDTWYQARIWHDATNDLIGIRINDTHQNTAAHTTGVTAVPTPQLRFGIRQSIEPMFGRLQHWGWVQGGLLSSAEITEHYNGGAGQILTNLSAGLQAKFDSYWPMGEASGQRSDSIGTNHLAENNGPILSGPGIGA